jgi:tetraprenyl-beta-curcumene synthase
MKRIPKTPMQLMLGVYRFVLPAVRREINQIRTRASFIPDIELQTQALASIDSKLFHCQGGAVFALLNRKKMKQLIPLIVSFQTISDYLDNLCDRSISLDPMDFRLLHQSMLDAIQPGSPTVNYYAHRGNVDDGGYLQGLVEHCQSIVAGFPNYGQVQPKLLEWVGLYCDLQVHKHIHKDQREHALLHWWDNHKASYPELEWQEFAAATGSTLGMFMCFVFASNNKFDNAEFMQFSNAYFPYVCAVHILLDYFIDQEEDRLGGDLNFCNYYDDVQAMLTRLQWVTKQAQLCVSLLPNSQFHGMILEGLLALYLSDSKVNQQVEVSRAVSILMKNSSLGRLFFWINSNWIRKIYR